MKVLITGGCGFLGTNLASFFLDEGDQVFVIDSLFRKGSSENLKWLKENPNRTKLKFFKYDIANTPDIENIFKENGPFDYICHVAGQVAMTDSLADPRRDMLTNIVGTFNILECVRKFSPDSLVAYSSTNKVYGDLDWLNIIEKEKRYQLKDFKNGLNENIPLDFSTPYGCSKGAADQYVRDWARVYGIKTVVFRHSSIYGGRQFASINQGWIGWFCNVAIDQKVKNEMNKEVEEFTISGNGKQVRDVLNSQDLINLYFKAYLNKNKLNGEIFNIGGGLDNAMSILELLDLLREKLNIGKLQYKMIARRTSDQDCFIADINKAKNILNWEPRIKKEEGIDKMLKWCNEIKKNYN